MSVTVQADKVDLEESAQLMELAGRRGSQLVGQYEESRFSS